MQIAIEGGRTFQVDDNNVSRSSVLQDLQRQDGAAGVMHLDGVDFELWLANEPQQDAGALLTLLKVCTQM